MFQKLFKFLTFLDRSTLRNQSINFQFLGSVFRTFHLDQNPSVSFDSAPVPVSSTVKSPFDNSSVRKPITLWPGMYHSPVVNALWESRSSILSNLRNAPKYNQPITIIKTPSQSRTSILFKFSSDYTLREQYRNPWNEVRTGKLLEDLDVLAATISIKHCSDGDRFATPLILVTASVDRVIQRKPIRVDTDATITGAVTWVGRSSMEIQLEVVQYLKEASDPSESSSLTANFTFVARDSETGKAAPINKICPETEREILLWNEAKERNKSRKNKKDVHEQSNDIKGKEVNGIKESTCEARDLVNKDSILTKETCLESSLMCQPQQRNIHGQIFGGFLMRKAFELAFATAYSFTDCAPCFVEVDHVDFLKSVDVGNLVYFKSRASYTKLENPLQSLIKVEVIAHVMNPELRSNEVSNKFYFTFTVRSSSLDKGPKIQNVVPGTEEKARCITNADRYSH